MKNNLNYTNLTYDQMIDQIRSQLASDPRYANIRESSVFTTLVEIFVNVVDLNNFYIQNQANESYLDTARLYSSVILLSRMLGYVPARPEPASSTLSIELTGPIPPGISEGDVLYFKKRTAFTFDGIPFILKNTYKYTFTYDDIVDGASADWSKTLNYALLSDSSNYDLIVSATSLEESQVLDVEILQGEIKSQTILGSDSNLVGMKFQRYSIPDATFSNLYGENDLGYNPETGEQNQAENLTRVAISDVDVFEQESQGTLPNYDDFYDIDRKTLLRVDSPLAEIYVSAVPICLLRSSLSKEAEVVFGDNIFTRKGLQSTSDNIYIQYLSTLGAEANRLGVVGQELQTGAGFFVNSVDFSGNVTFRFSKNITGGADFEDIDSIKINAPATYPSFDRLVTKKDYISFLKTLTSPIAVKNAVAWGEQEEGDAYQTGIAITPIKKLFNIALFSALGSLYNTDIDAYTAKMIGSTDPNTDISDAVLDDNYNPYENLPSSYFNILIKESVPDELNYVTNLPPSSKILKVTNKLKNKSQITVKNIYISPFIEEFQMVGQVYIRNFSDVNSTQKAINNSIYEYLNKNADFEVPIYVSNIVEIIENNPNVIYSDVRIIPFPTSGVTFDYNYDTSVINDSDLSSWTPVGNETSAAIENIIRNSINQFLDSRSSYNYNEIVNIFSNYQVRSVSEFKLNNITERNFYNELIKDMYESLLALAGGSFATNSFANSENFENIVVKLRNSFDTIIKLNMIDNNGNISRFSLPNQIAKLSINITYLYK